MLRVPAPPGARRNAGRVPEGSERPASVREPRQDPVSVDKKELIGVSQPAIAWSERVRSDTFVGRAPAVLACHPALEGADRESRSEVTPRTEEREATVRARARHILVDDEKFCQDLKRQIEGGSDFADLAKQHSGCPSGKQGGDLGEFAPGQMVREFDDVVFSKEVGAVHGPVKTQFGYHLIEIVSRME
jgi:peptidyl-prolyl cis-trans isomerase C